MEDPMIPARKPEEKPEPPVTHDKAFRPTKAVFHEKAATMAIYEYKENPPTELKRRPEPEGEERPGFKATYKGLSRP